MFKNQLILNQMLFCLNPLMLLDLHFLFASLPMEKNSKKKQQKELSEISTFIGASNSPTKNATTSLKHLENITKTSVPLDAIKHSVSFIRV